MDVRSPCTVDVRHPLSIHSLLYESARDIFHGSLLMASEATPHSTGPHIPGGEADPNSSSSTLVNLGLTSLSAHDPVSPGSASFDPNAPAPLALRDGLYPITEVQLRPGATDVNALWAHRLSASFGAIADQIAAASRALAVPPSAPAANGSGATASQGEVAALAARLDLLERAQGQLGADLQQVQAQLARLEVSGTASASGSAAKQPEVAILEVEHAQASGEDTSGFKSATEIAIEELQKKVDGAIDTIKLEQARLYARLHNATVTSNKMAIKALMMANGKPPQNFPNTKGEFEHLTKERYEHILKSYDVVPKGDTKAKREQLREFIGLTPSSN
ncbi:hypothetical protein GSI_11404 [Ganoderma sinense ZZ0214-1]|uniref:Uncharacterized protein n=1 Tax=Ganoderma sinense ZZ0214-1 TaxID=1077348 RepID=A0A2G8RVZ4_9APHY|nr:hypothetical protein GSI_11404 [Ganoderma sinense ZZ0214-1]